MPRFCACGVLIVVLFSQTLAPVAKACNFCTPVASTFAEEMDRSDVVAIARVLPRRKGLAATAADTRFEFIEVLKGKGLAKKLPDTVEISGAFTARTGDWYVLMGSDAPVIAWSVPVPASRTLSAYLQAVLRLPKVGPQRASFYHQHLQSSDEMIAYDAYEEFARVPYAQLKQLKGLMNHDRLVAWIQDPQTPASRRRLYFTMLGICGSQQDVPMLERLIQSQERKDKRGIEALLACYLTLRGAAGLDRIDKLYLSNSAADYAETYGAIMAIRFHLRDERVISRQSLVASLRLMLNRPELADLVIPDLARAEDWTVIDRLMELFWEAKPEYEWVRVPVINYLRSCPLPIATILLGECERLDPAAYERSLQFHP